MHNQEVKSPYSCINGEKLDRKHAGSQFPDLLLLRSESELWVMVTLYLGDDPGYKIVVIIIIIIDLFRLILEHSLRV